MTLDKTTLLNGRVKLTQSVDGLRASMDSVLLANAVTASSGQAILDMGCGTGAVGLSVHARMPALNLSITGIDIQDQMIAIARENAEANNLMADYKVADVADKSIFAAQGFDHIVMNPPYYASGARQQSPDPVRERAYTGDLETWMGSALYWVKHGGSLSVIHRADALNDILFYAERKFGAIEVWPVHSKPYEPAIRVIVKMIRNRKTPLTLYPPIVMFDENGQPSARSNALLRDGAGLV